MLKLIAQVTPPQLHIDISAETIQAFQELRARYLEFLNHSEQTCYLSPETAKAYCGFENTFIAREKFKDAIGKIGGTFNGVEIGFDLKRTQKPATTLLDELMELPRVFLDCTGAFTLASLMAYRSIVGDDGFNRLYNGEDGFFSTITIGGIVPELPYSQDFKANEDGFELAELPESNYSFCYISGCKSYARFHPRSVHQGYSALIKKERGQIEVLAFQGENPTKDYETLLSKLKKGVDENLTFQELADIFDDKDGGSQQEIETYMMIFRENGDTRTIEMDHKMAPLLRATPHADSEFRIPRYLLDEQPIGVTLYEKINGIYFFPHSPSSEGPTPKMRRVEMANQ